MCASTRWPFSSSTRNMALGRGSTTVPSSTIASSLGLGSFFSWGILVPVTTRAECAETAPGTIEKDISPGDRQHFWAVLGEGDGGLELGREAPVGGDDRPAVDREDVPVLQLVGAGDAVHDRVVGRRADHRREPVVIQEVRAGTACVEDRSGELVELGGGDAGAGRVGALVEHLGDDAAGAAHLVDLGAALQHGRAPRAEMCMSIAWVSRNVTVSGSASPSTLARRWVCSYQAISGLVCSS